MQKKNKWFGILVLLVIVLLGYEIYVSRGTTYYYTSFGIVLLSIMGVLLHFEKERPDVMLLTMIASLCALAIVSRIAFFFLPQMKPIAAIVILSGVAFGMEVGFVTGAVSAFVTNFYFGQGSWTPFQMFALGLIGAIAGKLFFERERKDWQMILYSFLSVFFIYGGIVDINTIFFTSQQWDWRVAAGIYMSGVPFDFLFALSTALFLVVLKNPILKRIGRIQKKYCLIDKKVEK